MEMDNSNTKYLSEQTTGEKEPMGVESKLKQRLISWGTRVAVAVGTMAALSAQVDAAEMERNQSPEEQPTIENVSTILPKPSPAEATEPNEPLLFAQNLAPGELANLFQNQVKSPIEGALYYFNGSSWVLASGGWGGRLTREMGRIDNRSRIINRVSWELYFYRDTNGRLLCMAFKNK
jgi:hypothetical protein